MKFIHTADWHLGNRMYDINRCEEYEAFFSWLKDEIVRENAGTLIVSGDIYDTTHPTTEARTQYFRFLTSLVGTCCKNIVIVGGNHDSGLLLDSEKTLLELLNIHVVGSIANAKIEDIVFELFDSGGNVEAICCAIPYARESELRRFHDEESDDGTFSDKAYGELYRQALEAAKIKSNGKDVPIVATGHLYAANLEGRLKDVQGEIKSDDGTRMLDVVGKLGSVHAGIFPKDFDYVALGHIHYASTVDGNQRIRYSGSPFVMGFDEANIPRNVLSVEIDSDHKTTVKKIQIPQQVVYRRISGNCTYIIDELLKYEGNPPEKNTFIEAYFIAEDGINIHDKIESIRQKLPDCVSVVNVKAQQRQIDSDAFGNIDMDDLKNFDATEIFRRLILSKKAALFSGLPDEEQKSMKDELVKKYMPLFLEIASEMEKETK